MKLTTLLVCSCVISAAANANQHAQATTPDVSRPQPVRPDVKTSPDVPQGMRGFERLRRLEYDVDAQGVTWVRGTTYKASFGAEGTTYIPFLGSRAPHNFPVALALAGASSGGEEIPLAAPTCAVRAADRITIDRGVVVEAYELSLESVEQTFIVEERPHGGDLTLWVAVSTELAGCQTSEAIEFGNALGQVRYGTAFVREPDGSKLAVESRLDGNAIRIDVPAEYLAGASFPLVIDPIISTFAVDPTSDDDLAADVAFDATNVNYYVVYEEAFSATDHDVYSRLIDDTGSMLSGGYVDTSTEDWRGPRCANLNAYDQYIVVASARAVAGEVDICVRGRLTGAATISYGAVFTVAGAAQDTGSKVNVDVGGDSYFLPPSYYCVVYERIFSTTDRDIHCQLVKNDGTRLNATTIYIDNSGGTVDALPSVSKGNAGIRWNIAWQREVTATDHDIRVAQIAWDGTIDTASTAVDSTTWDDTNPSAATPFDNGNWALVWERDFTTDHDIMAVNMAAGVHGTITNVSMFVEGAHYSENQIEPSADSDGQHFAVAYSESYNHSATDYDVCLSSLHVLGGEVYGSETHQILAFSSTHEGNPEITSRRASGETSNRYCIVWDDLTAAGNHDIEGGIYDSPVGGPIAAFCFGDGSGTACPCGNSGALGHGCANSVDPSGALLVATGTADLSSDTVRLIVSGLPAGTSCLFFQGTAESGGGLGTMFGDGLRCAAGSVIRLSTKIAVGDAAVYPLGGETALSVRGVIPPAGAQRDYQVWYRNAATFCTASGFNLSNGLRMTWLP